MSRPATRLLAVPALLLALVACGGDEEVTATETETETVEVTETDAGTGTETVETGTDGAGDGGVELTQSCESAEGGLAIRYPDGWHTNDGSVLPVCSFFHPEEFELPEGTEPPPLAVSVDREPVAFEQVTGDSPAVRVLTNEELDVSGRPAVRRETEATGEGLYQAGVRTLEYLVDLDGETLIASTRSTGNLVYEQNRTILDRMMETLELR